MTGWTVSMDLFAKLDNEQKADYVLWYSDMLDNRVLFALERYKPFLERKVYYDMRRLAKQGVLEMRHMGLVFEVAKDKTLQLEWWRQVVQPALKEVDYNYRWKLNRELAKNLV